MPSTTAARSCSATTASSTSRPASTSTPPTRSRSTSPRGKIHRINPDGTVPTDNPFYDGSGPARRLDLGARSAQPVPRLLRRADRADLHRRRRRQRLLDRARRRSTSAPRGANYGWPDCEGPCCGPRARSPLYSYPHNGRDAADHRRLRVSRHAVPQLVPGQLLLRRLHPELDPPPHLRRQRQRHGSLQLRARGRLRRRPVRRHRLPDRGPRRRGVLHRPRLLGHQRHVRRQQAPADQVTSQSNQAPVAVRSATPTTGPAPLAVTFSSAGSLDPEGQSLTYSWTFGDGGTSTAGEPEPHLHDTRALHRTAHCFRRRQLDARRPDIVISVGTPPDGDDHVTQLTGRSSSRAK